MEDRFIDNISTDYQFDKVLNTLADWGKIYYMIYLVDVSFTENDYQYLLDISRYASSSTIWYDHHCVGCQNPETWDFNGGIEIDLINN